MKLAKILPALAFIMCVPGVVLRALHFLSGFDADTGLPAISTPWVWYFTILLLVCAAAYFILARPLKALENVAFEQLIGTDNPTFRIMSVIAGLLMIAGGGCYFYFTLTAAPESMEGWAHIFELVYAAATILAGFAIIAFAKAQASEITEKSAMLTLVPLLWSCLHLLVNYRMTCTDPKLPSFAFGLVADILVATALYNISRLLYDKPRPAALGAVSALAITVSVADLGGYALSRIMGVHSVSWTPQMILRSGLTVSVCLFLAAELTVLARRTRNQE